MKKTYESWYPIIYRMFIEELRNLINERFLEDMGIKNGKFFPNIEESSEDDFIDNSFPIKKEQLKEFHKTIKI